MSKIILLVLKIIYFLLVVAVTLFCTFLGCYAFQSAAGLIVAPVSAFASLMVFGEVVGYAERKLFKQRQS